jgi:hypothetical protein
MAEEAIDYLKINLEGPSYCEVRAMFEGTVADLHIQSRSFSINVWRKLILPCMKCITLNLNGTRQ